MTVKKKRTTYRESIARNKVKQPSPKQVAETPQRMQGGNVQEGDPATEGELVVALIIFLKMSVTHLEE